MSRNRWPLVLISPLIGVVFGALAITAWIHGFEHLFALVVLAVVGLLMAIWVPEAPLRTAFAGGCLASLAAILTQAAFLPLYFKNNPAYQSVDIPLGLDPRIFTILFAPVGGMAGGVIAMLAAWSFTRFVRPNVRQKTG